MSDQNLEWNDNFGKNCVEDQIQDTGHHRLKLKITL